jgi:hypothetical protein
MNGIENQRNAWLHPPKGWNISLYTNSTSSFIGEKGRKGERTKGIGRDEKFYSQILLHSQQQDYEFDSQDFLFPRKCMKNHLLFIHNLNGSIGTSTTT